MLDRIRNTIPHEDWQAILLQEIAILVVLGLLIVTGVAA